MISGSKYLYGFKTKRIAFSLPLISIDGAACNGTVCMPPMEFKWGRKDCVDENRLVRQFPGGGSDPRQTIRQSFRMNLEEIVALMGKLPILYITCLLVNLPNRNGT